MRTLAQLTKETYRKAVKNGTCFCGKYTDKTMICEKCGAIPGNMHSLANARKTLLTRDTSGDSEPTPGEETYFDEEGKEVFIVECNGRIIVNR